jgi:DNA adenine methylase
MTYWNSHKETEPIKKALRFLLLSNFGYMGKPSTLTLSTNGNTKSIILEKINPTFEYLSDCYFSNKDAVRFINSIHFKDAIDLEKSFIYNDPPYLGTIDNYEASFTEQQSGELFECLVKRGCKFAMSEFDHPFILEQAKRHNLNVITVGERRNMKDRRVEILVTNYDNRQTKLF